MFKLNKKILKALLLSLIAVLFTIGLTGCFEPPTLEEDPNVNENGSPIVRLMVSGYKNEFRVNDIFEFGDGFKVMAVYSDGSQKDVTDQITVEYEDNFNQRMDTAGEYQVVINYGGKKEVYDVWITSFSDILRELTVNAENAKKNYKLGEDLSFENVSVTATYENAQGKMIQRTFTDLEKFKISIVDQNGKRCEETFEDMGDYEIVFSIGLIQGSYTVSVHDVEVSTVKGALYVAQYASQFVSSGTTEVKENSYGGGAYPTYYTYKFGDNYTYISEYTDLPDLGTTKTEYHYSVDTKNDNNVILVTIENGKVITNNLINENAVKGVQYLLWFYSDRQFGIEAALSALYKMGQTATNEDFKQSVDGNVYKFSYSTERVMALDIAKVYFFTVSAQFTLNEEHFISSAKFSYCTYTRNTYSKLESGKYITVGSPEYIYEAEVTQAGGPRDADKNSDYSLEKLQVQSIEFYYNGKKLEYGERIPIDLRGGTSKINLEMRNIVPSTANFSADILYLSDGIFEEQDSAVFFSSEGYDTFRVGNNTIYVQFVNGGPWDLIMHTANFEFKVTFDVIVDTKTITSEFYNAHFNSYTTKSETLILPNTYAYFRSVAPKFELADSTAKVVSGNASACSLTETVMGGERCFAFIASEPGIYKVEMKAVYGNATCTVTIKVSDVPSYDVLLNGTYTATDSYYRNYTLTFEPEQSEDGCKGKLTVVRVDTNGSTNTSIIYFSATDGELVVSLTYLSGINLGIDILINDKGELVMEDSTYAACKMTKVEE